MFYQQVETKNTQNDVTVTPEVSSRCLHLNSEKTCEQNGKSAYTRARPLAVQTHVTLAILIVTTRTEAIIVEPKNASF